MSLNDWLASSSAKSNCYRAHWLIWYQTDVLAFRVSFPFEVKDSSLMRFDKSSDRNGCFRKHPTQLTLYLNGLSCPMSTACEGISGDAVEAPSLRSALVEIFRLKFWTELWVFKFYIIGACRKFPTEFPRSGLVTKKLWWCALTRRYRT